MNTATFSGSDYVPEHDEARLSRQMARVYRELSEGEWFTLAELAAWSGAPEASVSAQIRNLRKPQFGGHVISKRVRGDRKDGLWEYKLETVR